MKFFVFGGGLGMLFQYSYYRYLKKYPSERILGIYLIV